MATVRLKPMPGIQAEVVGQLASKAYNDDAGFDLYCAETVVVSSGEFVDISLGVEIELPYGHWGMLTGRSSTLRKLGLLVNQGVIDHGYRGPLFAGVWNLTEDDVKVWAGDRIAQLILLPTWEGKMVMVQELTSHPRGQNGFGSSGT